VVEVLNRWKRTYAKDLEVCLIESLEELTSAMEAEPNDAVAQVGVHFVTIFVHWWKLQLDPGRQAGEPISALSVDKLGKLTSPKRHFKEDGFGQRP